jgi:hypothetical protein
MRDVINSTLNTIHQLVVVNEGNDETMSLFGGYNILVTTLCCHLNDDSIASTILNIFLSYGTEVHFNCSVTHDSSNEYDIYHFLTLVQRYELDDLPVGLLKPLFYLVDRKEFTLSVTAILRKLCSLRITSF